MFVLNKLHHSDEQFAKLVDEPDEGPVFMVNLFKFKEKAVYEDSRETQLSGIEAYQLYGKATAKHVEHVGGRIIHSSQLGGMVCGEVEDLWDAVAIVEYPSIAAFLEMVGSDDWSKHAVHQTAGLEGQLNIFSRTPPT